MDTVNSMLLLVILLTSWTTIRCTLASAFEENSWKLWMMATSQNYSTRSFWTLQGHSTWKELCTPSRYFHLTTSYVLKHAGLVDLGQKSKFSLDSIDFFVDRFKSYLKITEGDLHLLETEFTLYQSLQTQNLSKKALEEATIRVCVVDDTETVAYRNDVLWHYIEHEFMIFMISGSQRSKFYYLSRIARLLLTLPYSNADAERVFSRVNKNKTKFRDSLSLDRMLMPCCRP